MKYVSNTKRTLQALYGNKYHFKKWKRFEQINAQKIDEAQIQFEKWWLCLIYSEEGEFMLLKFNLSFFVPGSRFLWIMELAHFASVLSRLASGQFQIKANAKNIIFYENLEFSSA